MRAGGFDLLADPGKFEKLPHAKFVEITKKHEKKLFGDRNLSIKDIEDLHWQKLCTTGKQYAINNQISLFGDGVNIWNLDRFTTAESNIHGRDTHHTLQVSIGIIGLRCHIFTIVSIFRFYFIPGTNGAYIVFPGISFLLGKTKNLKRLGPR